MKELLKLMLEKGISIEKENAEDYDLEYYSQLDLSGWLTEDDLDEEFERVEREIKYNLEKIEKSDIDEDLRKDIIGFYFLGIEIEMFFKDYDEYFEITKEDNLDVDWAYENCVSCKYISNNLPSIIESHIDWSGVVEDLKTDYCEVKFMNNYFMYRER